MAVALLALWPALPACSGGGSNSVAAAPTRASASPTSSPTPSVTVDPDVARCQGDNDFLNGIIDTWQEQTEALNDSKLRDQDYTKHIRQLRALRAKVKDRQVSTPMVHDRSLILAGLDDLAEGLLKEVEAITTEAYDEGAKLALLGQNALQTAGDDLFASSFQCVPGA